MIEAHAAPKTRYRRLFELATGGMGVVHVAQRREGSFRRLVAMKRLHADPNPESQRMFLEEARLAGMLRHPNVVAVSDFGVDVDGPFLIMDLVEGVSLQRILRGVRHSGRPLPLQHVTSIGALVAEGLAAAHGLLDERGRALCVVHRDVSPHNILVGFDGSVRLSDFGIARAAVRNVDTTSSGVLKGKLGYMSPEQLRFRTPDARSDLFALGVVLFEMASGERLYGGEDGMIRILEEPVPNLRVARPEVPANLRALVTSLLAKAPKERPTDAQSVANALHEMHAEFIVEEGHQALRDFVAELLPGAESELRDRIAAAEREAAAHIPTARRADSEAQTSSTTKAATAPVRWPLYVAAMAIVLLGGSWFVLGLFDDPLRSEVPETSPTVVEAPPEAHTPAAPVTVVDEAPLEGENDRLNAVSDDAASSAHMEQAPRRVEPRRAPRRRRRNAPRTEAPQDLIEYPH